MNPDSTWPTAPGAESIDPPLSTRDLRTFAGPAFRLGPFRGRPDYYVSRWGAMLSSEATRAGFNWAAALCGANWCFWRKLYGLALTILVAEFVTSLLLAMIFVQAFGLEPGESALGVASWMALVPVRGMLGAYANTLYLDKAIQAVSAARRLQPDEAGQDEFLAERGGTSWGVLGLALGVQLMLMWLPAASA